MLKKYLWLKNLIFLCLLSYLLAKICSALLVARMDAYRPYLSGAPATGRVERNVAGERPLRDYRLILKRNVFNSEHTKEPQSGPRHPTAESTDPLQKSDLSVLLLGTVVGLSQESFAIIEDHQTRRQELFQVDDMIQDQARVVAISRCNVVVLRNGKKEILECPELGSTRSTTKRTEPLPVRTYRSSSRDASVKVRRLSESEYVLDQATVENAMSNYNQILTQIGITPNFVDGKPDGLRLTQVKPNSLWDKAGLKSGDVIRRVNDMELSSVDSAMNAFEAMRKEQDISMEISRAGKSQSIHWGIE